MFSSLRLHTSRSTHFFSRQHGWPACRPLLFLGQATRLSSALSKTNVPPPSLFQDADNQPVPYHILKQQQQQQQTSNFSVSDQRLHNKEKKDLITENVTLFQLFTNKYTRAAAFRLFILLFFSQVLAFYYSCREIIQELDDTESKLSDLWELYERRDISQSVMAVHIGQLKQQLINAGIKPINAQQALTIAQHLLSFERDKDTGNLMIYVDPNSQIYKLVPFSYEYDIQKIPSLNNVIEKTWEDFNNLSDNNDDDDGNGSSNDNSKQGPREES